MKPLSEARLTPTDRQAVEAAARILRERFPVAALVLFGSKARGDDTPESDIDLLVLTSRPLSFAEDLKVTDSLFDLQLKHGVLFSTLVVSAAEWEEGVYQVLPIRHEVEREGVML